jgi:hypothetical protein
MHLETTETHASLALALVPPGNILRDLAMIRGKLFTVDGLQGSRAWFDFPVLAWLGRSMDGGLLASLASSLRIPLDFGAMHWEGNFLALSIPEGFNEITLPGLGPYIIEHPASVTGTETYPRTGQSRGEWCHGPFPSGKGMICAVLHEEVASGTTDRKAKILAEATRRAGSLPRATIYSVAMVELHWYPGPDYGSSWAILSSAVAGKVRPASRSVPVIRTMA